MRYAIGARDSRGFWRGGRFWPKFESAETATVVDSEAWEAVNGVDFDALIAEPALVAVPVVEVVEAEAGDSDDSEPKRGRR